MIQITKHIPLFIHSSFWVLALLIGFLNSSTVWGIGSWVVVVFISVLVHELGHAVTAIFFGHKVHIEFSFIGGLTVRHGRPRSRSSEFFIVMMGPLFGALLACFAYMVLMNGVSGSFSITFFSALYFANVFWTALNLIPVYPLDGSKLLVLILEGLFGSRGVRVSYFVSGLVAMAVFFYFLVKGALIPSLFFLMWAFDSFREFKNESSPPGTLQNSLDDEEREKALEEWQQQEPEKAIVRLETLLKSERSRGDSFLKTLHLLSDYLLATGQTQKAYQLLSSYKNKLRGSLLKQLQLAAYKIGNWKEAQEVGSKAFLEDQDISCALLNAFSSAQLGQVAEAVHWLRWIESTKEVDVTSILKAEDFEAIRHHLLFQQFTKVIK
jgi:stage IV sporulation protein FB